MSVLTRNRRLTDFSLTSEAAHPTPPAAAPLETEAPERAASPCEAPESRRARRAEAPDAGEGRNSYHENEFKHGRSQS